jgi:GNAT superfamily N-acetyltransferase
MSTWFCVNSGALCLLFTDFIVLPARRVSEQRSGNSVAGWPWRQFDARVRIEQFEPGNDAGRLKACHDIVLAGAPIDHPSLPPWPLQSFRFKWTRSFDSAPSEAWLATDDSGEPAGCYLLRLPVKENVTLAEVILQVPPARRRAGIGSELLAHCVGRARRAGRGRLGGEARDGSPGAAFAQAAGAQAGIVEVNRILDIDSSLPARLDRLRAEAQAKSAGYSLLSWFGATPGEHLAAVARLNNAMTDAPHDEGVQATKWDGPRVAEQEEHALAHGLRFRTVAARDDGTGELAALTQICTDDATPGWAFQQITAVSKGHRGHRLGLLVKVANLEQLTSGDPSVRRVLTGNAGANRYMIAINEMLGFHVSDHYRSWDLDLAAGIGAAR